MVHCALCGIVWDKKEIIRILLTMNGRGRDRRIRDRICALTNELISGILSFLPIKDAVATSTLSLKMAQLPDIEIDDYSLRDIDHDQCHTIVGKILSPQMPPPLELSKVKMKFYDHTYPADITTLIRASLKRIVKELDLSICPDDEGNSEEVNFQLPMEVFTNQHLQVLKLSKVKVVVPPDSRHLSRFCMWYISYYCDKSLQDFYSFCPVLEDLTLEGELNEYPDEEVCCLSFLVLRCELWPVGRDGLFSVIKWELLRWRACLLHKYVGKQG
ncbi:hypothetical protein PRUPE_1G285400 [Prunus persica]|uniref:FBD domain-containing protein n=1 Tax=Prunus persica TaxID=3760 RepID=A0A251R4M1_PRUPE|nr:hypothetical protein PRUPE_1G285400 [Prunus persica]